MNYSTISFPSLGLEMNPPRSFSIASFDVYFYGILIALGLILAVVYALRRKTQFGLTEDDLIDGVLCIVPFAVICARLYYCVFSWDMYADNPISILYIWEGGLAIYGGVLGALVGILVYCKVKKINPLTMFDIVSLGFLIGQSIGRWGNFFNREAFGAETENFLRMGLYNTISDTTTFHHPTFLYESVWNFVGFIALHFLSKKRKYDGQISLGYVAWYGLGRTMIEGLRTDSLYWGDFRVSQVLAAVSCLLAVGILVWQAFRPHESAKLYVNQIAAKAAASAEAESTAPQDVEEISSAEEFLEEAAALPEEADAEQDGQDKIAK